MPEFLHTDPNSGLSYYSEHDPLNPGKVTISSVQDVEPVLDEAKRRRNSGSGDQRIAGHMNHYCMLPNSVILQLMNKGINIFRMGNDDWRKFGNEIETNYPYLKVTDKKIWRPT